MKAAVLLPIAHIRSGCALACFACENLHFSACRELVAVILGVRKDHCFLVFCFAGYPFSYLERYQKLQILNATDIAVFNA